MGRTGWNNLLVRPAPGITRIGNGSFGAVFMIDVACSVDEKAAVKQVVGKKWFELVKETTLQERMRHPNILQVFDYMPRSQEEFEGIKDADLNGTLALHHAGKAELFNIMMEAVTGGDLADYLYCRKDCKAGPIPSTTSPEQRY